MFTPVSLSDCVLTMVCVILAALSFRELLMWDSISFHSFLLLLFLEIFAKRKEEHQ